MKGRAILIAAVAFLGVLLATGEAQAQCRLCSAALESGGGEGLIRGFYWSILLILGTPFLLLGSFVGAIVYTRRKNAREALALQDR